MQFIPGVNVGNVLPHALNVFNASNRATEVNEYPAHF